MKDFESSIEVNVPVREVYNQWTQFEQFPDFMQSVKKVEQTDDTHLHWIASVGGRYTEWDAEIVEQSPDRAIQWQATEGAANAGAVVFDQLSPDKTKVTLKLSFEPDGLIETAGAALGVVQAEIEKDLASFKEQIENKQSSTGAWRGEVHHGQAETPDAPGDLGDQNLRDVFVDNELN